VVNFVNCSMDRGDQRPPVGIRHPRRCILR
jgi:hypothetical protein